MDDHGPLTRYVKLRVAYAPECRERFPRDWLQRKPPVSDPDMYHGTCVTLWWRGQRSRHSRRMRHPQLYLSGKRPIRCVLWQECDTCHFVTLECSKISWYLATIYDVTWWQDGKEKYHNQCDLDKNVPGTNWKNFVDSRVLEHHQVYWWPPLDPVCNMKDKCKLVNSVTHNANEASLEHICILCYRKYKCCHYFKMKRKRKKCACRTIHKNQFTLIQYTQNC